MKLLNTILITSMFAYLCQGQTNNLLNQSIDWGPSVNRVQMSVSMSNSVVAAGSIAHVALEMKNLSKRVVGMAGRINRDRLSPSLVPECTISLTAVSGERYTLTPERPVDYADVPPVSIQDGMTNMWKVPLDIKGLIVPGDYTLSATQSCFFMDGTNHDHFQLVSNVLKVQVK